LEAYKIKPVLFLFALGLLAATKTLIQKKREKYFYFLDNFVKANMTYCHIKKYNILPHLSHFLE
jgi:hypothetical protein